jgi:hypothetical protein
MTYSSVAPSIRSVRRLTVAVLALVTLAACSNDESLASPTRTLRTVDVTLASSSIEVGQFTEASAVALDQFAEPIPTVALTFSSNKPEVAGVSPTTGKIFAISPGKAEIFATADGRTGSRTITVTSAPAMRVNEVESNGDAPGGWVELFNPTAVAVDISGWTITSGEVVHEILLAAGTTIPARGYLVLDESILPGGLGAADGVHLFSRYGVHVDGFSWTSKATTTYGRCANGSGDFVVTDAPTKGAANACTQSRAL